jgi:putative ABC transport system ATP-binding protein
MILFSHICKTFNPGKEDEVRALKPIDLEIQRGDFVIIVGSNGSGKSTLLNLLQGSEMADEGKILINNKDIGHLAEHKRSRFISRVFQNPSMGIAAELTVLENFRLAAIRTKSKSVFIGNDASFRKRAEEKIKTLDLGLEKKLDQRMGSLSGGQRQALTLLMAVMDETKVLLMDEPTAALDPRSSEVIMQLTEKLQTEMQLTVLLVTHDMKSAHRYGNRLIQFKEGQISKDLKEQDKKSLSLPELWQWFS